MDGGTAEFMEARVIKAVRPWALFFIGSVSLTTSIILWTFATFATKEQLKDTVELVNDKHKQAIEHSDANFKANREPLVNIQESLKTIESRTWELIQQNKRK